jgi:hypothetical protein
MRSERSSFDRRDDPTTCHDYSERRTPKSERRFDAVGVEIKAYAEGIVDGRRTARAAEEWRKAVEHERSHGLQWQDRLNIQTPQVSDPGASIDPH